ncbi:MAG: hypothetical protein K1000chlam2_00715 [Chlamydiae bacterium]|nr:hypothetical protein [Chlamydiota bacterium]
MNELNVRSPLISSNFDIEDAVGPCCSCTVISHKIITPRDWCFKSGGDWGGCTILVHGFWFTLAVVDLFLTIKKADAIVDRWILSGIGVSVCAVGFFCNLGRSVAQWSGFDKRSMFQHAVTCSWGVSTALFVSAMITRATLE